MTVSSYVGKIIFLDKARSDTGAISKIRDVKGRGRQDLGAVDFDVSKALAVDPLICKGDLVSFDIQSSNQRPQAVNVFRTRNNKLSATRYMGNIVNLNNDHILGRGLLAIEDEFLKRQGLRTLPFSVRAAFHTNPTARLGQPVSFQIGHSGRGPWAVNIFVIPDNAPIIFDPDNLEDRGAIPKDDVELSNEVVSLKDTSGANDDKLIALAVMAGKIKLVSVSRDGVYRFLDDDFNLHNIVYLAVSELFSLQTAIEELEDLVNSPKAMESDFQNFFEKNQDFIVNDGYRRAHSHVILSKETGEWLIPDFVLEPVEQGSLCDILELKLPTADIFVLKNNRARYSAAVFEAAAQLREYSRFFDEERNRDRFNRAYPSLRAFKPRMFVIIGRSGKVTQFQRREIESDFPNLTLRTYDQLVARMKWKFDRMKTGRLRI